MNILLTGANGYIGLRLLPVLLGAGHTVIALVRDARRLPADDFSAYGDQLQVLEADLEDLPSEFAFPRSIDVAYFLVHGMTAAAHFSQSEARIARSFLEALQSTQCRRVVYLSGIVPKDPDLSQHLSSRLAVQRILESGPVPVTTLRASIIVGSGSASFEIIRDLTEKLPVMVLPRWTRNRCQPIAIRNVIAYLVGAADHAQAGGRTFDIGGPEVLTYRALLEQYADKRKLRRLFLPVPFLSLKLSSWWLYFTTNTNFRIARLLVDSMAHETICQDHVIQALIPQSLLTYQDAIEKAFSRIAQHRVPSSWFDALASGRLSPARLRSVRVPAHGVLRDCRIEPLISLREDVIRSIWSLGGAAGWPSMNWAWKLRGALDRLVGGTGVRRGRRDSESLRPGDALDFWRVLLADRANGRLILYAEMRLPGEAWLEFNVSDATLRQTATFRPLGVTGRLYWMLCLPFHAYLFPKMARRLVTAPQFPKALNGQKTTGAPAKTNLPNQEASPHEDPLADRDG